MWDKNGKWRPQDYSLHYTYGQLNARPTEQEKVHFIDNMFNSILERSASRANFSDFRAELVDHYVSGLGDDFHLEGGRAFQQRVLEYHESFGGGERIKKIGSKFISTKRGLIRRQFFKWFIEYWPAHLAFLPLAYGLSLNVHFSLMGKGLFFMTLAIAIIEGVKTYRDRKLIDQSRTGDSSVSFFYQYKYEIFSSLYVIPQFMFGSHDRPDSVFGMIFPLFFYFCLWQYYYHLNICQKRIAPLLQEYKAQMI